MDIGGVLGSAYIRQSELRYIRGPNCLRGSAEGGLATNVGQPDYFILVSGMGNHEPGIPR